MLLDPYPYLYFKVTEIQSSLFICVHLCSSLFILNHLGSSSYIFINLCTTFVSNFWSLCNFCSSTSWFVWIWLTQCVLYKKKESPRVARDVWVLSRQTFLTDTTCAHYYSLRSKTQSSFVTKRSTFGNAKDQIKCEINSQKMNCKRCHDVATYI